MAETLNLRATMQGHTDWVTCLATTIESSDIFLSGSRDKSIIVWTLGDSETYGTPRRALTVRSRGRQTPVQRRARLRGGWQPRCGSQRPARSHQF